LGPGLTLQVPLTTRGLNFGTLTLYQAGVPVPSLEGWQELGVHLALPIALAIENALLRGDATM
jgi:GAF domain-containing protein